MAKKIVVVVGEVGRSSSFCKHTTSMGQSQYAQLGHNTVIGELYYNHCGVCKWCNLRDRHQSVSCLSIAVIQS